MERGVESGYDGGPATVTAAAGRGSLPVISVSSVLANLTNYTLPQPELLRLPAHWSRKQGGGWGGGVLDQC